VRFVLDLQRAVLNSAMPATARHLLLTLAVKADWETGVIPPEHSPGLTTLVVMTGLAKSTIAEWLEALETAGWVKRDRPDRASKYTRTGYTLLIGSAEVTKPDRASRRTTALNSPPAGPLTTHEDDTGSRPPSGPVRQADHSSSPPSGTSAVRPADTSSPPGGPASIRNSPSESSSKDILSGARPAPAADASAPIAEQRRRFARRAAGILLPADFHATDEMRAWARLETPNVGYAETAQFVDYWRSQTGPKSLRPDHAAWVAAWRLWMRDQQKRVERLPSFRGTPVQTAVEPAAAAPPDGPRCPRHPGRRAATCGLCRSERIEAAPTSPAS